MKMKSVLFTVLAIIIGFMLLSNSGCSEKEVISDTGVKKVTADVKVGQDGLTTEQRNVKNRYKIDNKVGSIKHLYVISAYSGQVILYSTVDSKVTSSQKRLTPSTVAASDAQYTGGVRVPIHGRNYHTTEVLQDDGTYGHSIPYLYWFDVRGIYHQHYISGGQIIHISDQPIAVKNIIINLESAPKKK